MKASIPGFYPIYRPSRNGAAAPCPAQPVGLEVRHTGDELELDLFQYHATDIDAHVEWLDETAYAPTLTEVLIRVLRQVREHARLLELAFLVAYEHDLGLESRLGVGSDHHHHGA